MTFGKRKHSEVKESILDSDLSTLDGTLISPVKRLRTDSANNEETNISTRESSPIPTDAGVEEEENEVLRIIIPKDDHNIMKRDTFTEAEVALATDSSNSNPQVEDLVQSDESVANDEQAPIPQQEYVLPSSPGDAIPLLSTAVFFFDSHLASQPTESCPSSIGIPPPGEGSSNSSSPVILQCRNQKQGSPTASQAALGTVLSRSPSGLALSPPASLLTMPTSETLQA